MGIGSSVCIGPKPSRQGMELLGSVGQQSEERRFQSSGFDARSTEAGTCWGLSHVVDAHERITEQRSHSQVKSQTLPI